MKFTQKMLTGTIQRRYKRFLSDIILDQDKQQIVAHVANTGKMTSCWEPGQKVILSLHDSPKRKLKYSLELIYSGESWIVVNTHLANKLVFEAIQKNIIKEIPTPQKIIPEFKIGKSRIDFLLEYSDHQCFIEVKSVTLKEKDTALFPDTISTRGQKHLEELIRIKQMGHRAVLLLLVQREDVTHFRPAHHIDPEYGRLLKKALNAGIEILVYQSHITPKEITINRPLAWELN
jgi:sugar fermentation stimulation protein A